MKRVITVSRKPRHNVGDESNLICHPVKGRGPNGTLRPPLDVTKGNPTSRGGEDVINIYKPIGLTPLQLINKFKKKYPKYSDKKIAYAGRLDPMAHGVMILLIEPETKNRTKYQNLDKSYEFEVLLGVETDTYDVLGKVKSSKLKVQSTISKLKVNKYIEKCVGIQKQKYPPYSSKAVNGKPLYWWARRERLGEIEIPKKIIKVYSLKLIKLSTISKSKLSDQVIKRLNLVAGDFRQDSISKSWNRFIENSKRKKFQVAKFRIRCSSGTYVRSIAHDMGKKLEVGAIAFNINRTRVGKFKLKESIKL